MEHLLPMLGNTNSRAATTNHVGIPDVACRDTVKPYFTMDEVRSALSRHTIHRVISEAKSEVWRATLTLVLRDRVVLCVMYSRGLSCIALAERIVRAGRFHISITEYGYSMRLERVEC